MIEKNTQPAWRQWYFYLGILIAIIGGAIYWFNSLQVRSNSLSLSRSNSSSLPSSISKANSAATAIAALGRLEPKGEITRVSAPASLEGTRIERLLVKQGDRVHQGQIIAVLDNNGRRKADLENAQAGVQVAQANLNAVKAGAKKGDLVAQRERITQLIAELNGQISSQQASISNLEAQLFGERTAQEATKERIQAQLSNSQNDCLRYQKLKREGAVSDQQRDNFCLIQKTNEQSLKEAQANLIRIEETNEARIKEAKANLDRTITTLRIQQNQAKASLNSLAEVRPVDVQRAQADLYKAITAVHQSEEDLALTYIRSPLDGQVLKVHVRAGEVIGDQGIAEIGRTDQMYVVAEVYETDVAKIRLAQKATVTSDAIQGKLYGQVDQIGLYVKQQKVFEDNPVVKTDNKVVDVKIRLDPQSSQRVAGFSNLQVQVVILP